LEKTLTSAAVERLKPRPGKRRWVRDSASQSLFLLIQPSGHKSWVMRFRRSGGKISKLALGPLDVSGRRDAGDPEIGQPLSLVAARRLAAKINSERAAGRDVVADNNARKHRRRVAIEELATNSFAAAVRDYVEDHARKLRSGTETARVLGLDPDDLSPRRCGLAERWADRSVASISADDLHAAVEEARRVGTPGVEVRRNNKSESRARKLHAALSSMFGWLAKRRRVAANLMLTIHGADPAPKRDRVLSAVEIAKLWKATDAVAAPFAAVIKLLLLTGARLNEIARLRWDEVSEDLGTISIPGGRTKNKLPFIIFLPPAGRDVVANVKREDGCAYVFTTNGLTPISGWSKTKARIDAEMGSGVPHWQFHDLRRTCATHMAEIGVAPHIVEAALNHVSGAKAGVAGTYNRAAYATEKRAALELWATRVQGIVSDNVVPIRGRR
jgi:integrase